VKIGLTRGTQILFHAPARLALAVSVGVSATLALAAPPPRPGPPGPPGRSGPPGSGPPPAAAPAAPVVEPIDKTPAAVPALLEPLGHAGDSPLVPVPPLNQSPMLERLGVPDRWRLGWPTWDRYNRQADVDPILMNTVGGDSPYTAGHPLNPYDRNVLKGDYPIIGNDIFMNATAVSDTLINHRKGPVPSGVSAVNPGSFDIFGEGHQTVVSQSFIGSVEVFKGNTAFRPVDWLFRATGVYNLNYVDLKERSALFVNPQEGTERDDEMLALQELFFEYHLGDVSPEFDFAATRVGRQLFASDFRGFIYNDVGDGVRLLGNFEANQIQYNIAFFTQTEKDTNSELAEMAWRDQQVLNANVYVQDFIWPGWTNSLSFHWNHDQSDEEYDENNFLVIPGLIGDARLHDIDAFYLGWASDGHVGRLNINHAFYYVLGTDSHNNIAGREVDLNAFMGAIELSVDMDWLRPKASVLYASGDDDPLDDTAGGFDGIHDNPVFAGGPSSYTQFSAFRLFGVDLVSNRSFYFDLAGTKHEGQANYVNPGTILFNVGLDAEITPKLRASLNVNSIYFADTSTLDLVLNQDDVDQHFGEEINLVFQYRPFLNNNVLVTAGGSIFFPGQGFEEIYEDDNELFQIFTALTLSF
jgi:hypothetical protein